MMTVPQFYFQEIPAEVMHEIITGMEESRPEPTFDEILAWSDRYGAASLEEWYDRVAEYKVSR